ncbi:transketolase family protein (plasmid) [Roseomonas sp. CCTCC AB2023176]|uniref:transketolase family protein n=1 Tax=Roseomonas sp. CCTCC AB2023176 TaxID=3342640 RepID=UPI0035DBB210
MAEGRTLGMGELETVEHRPSVMAPFSRGILAAQAARGDLVVLTADLGKYTDVYPFRDAHPGRFHNVGMAEQALVTVAAGLARTGHVPYCTTYGCFATRRAYDFLAIACAHGGANVKMFAALPGITTGYGGTHQAIEDLGLMRSIPDMTVIDPCDATEMEQVAEAAADIPGTVYCRLLRGAVPQVLDPRSYRFVPGRTMPLREGSDVAIVSTGFMTERCLDACRALETDGVEAGVLHVPTIKPFDAETVVDFVAAADRLVVVENHVSIGGLASLVFDAMMERGLCRPVLKIGIPDRFIECGSVPYLQDKYGLSTARLTGRLRSWLASPGGPAPIQPGGRA